MVNYIFKVSGVELVEYKVMYQILRLKGKVRESEDDSPQQSPC